MPFQIKTQYLLKRINECVVKIEEMLAEKDNTLEDLLHCVTVLDTLKTSQVVIKAMNTLMKDKLIHEIYKLISILQDAFVDGY
jgi:hypothetical protein